MTTKAQDWMTCYHKSFHTGKPKHPPTKKHTHAPAFQRVRRVSKILVQQSKQNIMIIWILFAIVFTVLLTKAIIETIWGSILIIYGIACHILAFALRLLAKSIRLWKRITGKACKKPRRQMTVAECFVVVNCPNSPEAKRILASLR